MAMAVRYCDRIVSDRSVRDSITIITIGYARFTKSQQQPQWDMHFTDAHTDANAEIHLNGAIRS